MLLAFSERSDDALIADMESCYTALKERFSVVNDLQSVAQMLSLTEGRPQQKAERLIELYNAVCDAGVKYGRSHELPTLAALSLTGAPIASLAEDVRDVYDYLKTQKGYGLLDFDARQRAMHAAMIVSDQYAVRDQVDTAAMAGTLAMIIAQQMAMIAVMAGTTASTAASSSH